MKTDQILTKAVAVLVAAAAIVLLARQSLSPDRVAGFLTVLVLLGIAASEYRVTWKSLIGR